ncbi:MAG: helix-turn-helix transcriptional regulator [Acidobacteriota bacterium]|nr:helix-turn-helix transcriptional regulator [Acidobacteriota bacterium]
MAKPRPASRPSAPDRLAAAGREILLSFWKIHILHHAAERPIVGQWMMEELREHGYRVSPGTLYPVLRRMESRGWLRSRRDAGRGRRARREYTLTPEGRAVLAVVRGFLRELTHEVRQGRRRRADAARSSR